MKLTKSQKARLWRLRIGGEYHVAGNPVVRALEKRGFVETNSFHCTTITPAGRDALAKESGE